MGKINLLQEELQLESRLKELVKETRESIKNHDIWGKIQENRYNEMAELAHKLHMSLKMRGYEPKHHRYMLENRGVPTEDIEFYNHIHPVEDLLAFINNTDANNDPEDSTIGLKFGFKIYTRRWGHYDTYTIKRTNNGWFFSGQNVYMSGDCDKDGKPFIFNTLEHDLVSYPYNIGELFEWIWQKAADGLDKDEVQKAIDDIAEWISTCEINTPRGIFEDLL